MRVVGYNRSFNDERGQRYTLDIERNDQLGYIRVFLGGPRVDRIERMTIAQAKELRDGLMAALSCEKESAR